jgi:hypothetical protein
MNSTVDCNVFCSKILCNDTVQHWLRLGIFWNFLKHLNLNFWSFREGKLKMDSLEPELHFKFLAFSLFTRWLGQAICWSPDVVAIAEIASSSLHLMVFKNILVQLKIRWHFYLVLASQILYARIMSRAKPIESNCYTDFGNTWNSEMASLTSGWLWIWEAIEVWHNTYSMCIIIFHYINVAEK